MKKMTYQNMTMNEQISYLSLNHDIICIIINNSMIKMLEIIDILTQCNDTYVAYSTLLCFCIVSPSLFSVQLLYHNV